MIDLIDVMSLKKPGVSLSDGSYTVLIPPDASGIGKLIQVKNIKGFPVDVILFDNNFCYDRLTERDKDGWLNPLDVKLHVGNDGMGTLIGPRFVTGGFPTPEAITEKASYEPFFNGKTDFAPKNVGRARSIWTFTDKIDWGGEVGKLPTYIRYYQWGGKDPVPNAEGYSFTYSDLETYHYAPPYGLVQWTHAKLNPMTGQYVTDIDPGIKNTTKPMLVKPAVNLPIMK